jgi:uncharacterized membrane protein YidH (DUF202 family)
MKHLKDGVSPKAIERFLSLVRDEVIREDDLRAAAAAAQARGLDIEAILIHEYGVPRHILLKALSNYYHCPFIEYDEKMPISPELLQALYGKRSEILRWFPVIKDIDTDTIVIATNAPTDPGILAEVSTLFKAEKYELWVALNEDIQWFIQDFLHAAPGELIGTERTGLAYWRNTMAHWRTRLACYRTDMAKARTDLAFLRWGLGLITISNTLMYAPSPKMNFHFYIMLMIAGGVLGLFGLLGYLQIRKTHMKPPENQTLVEVTAATLHFLENYHFIDGLSTKLSIKKTMLARLGDLLAGHSTILYPSPASRERTHLARERNVLAAQRTIAGCYRTIYARARTGLAFIRTGISFTSLGIGLITYFGFNASTFFDAALIGAGLLMIMDGLLWYLPVRKEQSEVARCVISAQ